ncbi:uncharacterized protein LOC124963442 isoform X2 [Sciurus carolinensis]|uniref:uncharacterized protein LOC124963442 isoform X2 n=1 Tax=Sciurus carolinensis TaxID=30640 RepID=UPI001FB4BFEE|nr:uncharacterized protein LOC124963442 isoform X2 [Sciurus carolinensis]
MKRSLVPNVMDLTVHDTPVCWKRETLQWTWLILASRHRNTLSLGKKLEEEEETSEMHPHRGKAVRRHWEKQGDSPQEKPTLLCLELGSPASRTERRPRQNSRCHMLRAGVVVEETGCRRRSEVDGLLFPEAWHRHGAALGIPGCLGPWGPDYSHHTEAREDSLLLPSPVLRASRITRSLFKAQNMGKHEEHSRLGVATGQPVHRTAEDEVGGGQELGAAAPHRGGHQGPE